MDLLKIESPAFIKVLSNKELEQLAQDVRDFMIESVSKTGGQLADNLSSIELTIALHRVFNSPADKILFDADNQAYAHKILTGRAARFHQLRQINGLSGYQSTMESLHDPFDASTIGQALSIGYGLSMKNDADHIIVVLSNQSLQSGQVYEALNHISTSKKKIIILINDNETIDRLGGVSTSLKNLMVAKPISQFRDDVNQFFKKGNVITRPLKKGFKTLTTNLSKTVTTSNLFTELGFKYAGPFDGHSVRDVMRVLNFAKETPDPVVIHFKTTKGKGYQKTQNDKDGLWVDLNEFDIETGTHKLELPSGFQKSNRIIVDYVKNLILSHKDLVLVNTLPQFENELEGDKVYHVESGSQHPLSFASGLALAGFRPIVLMDGQKINSYTQQLLLEFAGMNLDVSVLLFNASLHNLEGGIQKGLFDYPLLSAIPNIIVTQGKNTLESIQLIELSTRVNQPFIIRISDKVSPMVHYPVDIEFDISQWELIKSKTETPKAILFMVGPMIELIDEKITSNLMDYWIVNCRFMNQIDESLMVYLKSFDVPFFIVSQEYKMGALAYNIGRFMNQQHFTQSVHVIGFEREFVSFGSPSTIKRQAQLDTQSILNEISERVG